MQKFWIPKPNPTDMGTLSILIPVLASAVGLFLMAAEAMVFVQFASLPQDLRFPISVASAAFMAFGGEIGTVSNTVEVFRKYIRSKMNVRFEWDIVTGWDWAGLVVSAMATLMAFIIASSTRDVNTAWAAWAAQYLVLVLMPLAVADIYAGIIELGLRIGTYELRMQDWIIREEKWRQAQLQKQQVQLAALPTPPLAKPETKIARLKCWCGVQVASFEAYNVHLELHKAVAGNYDTVKEAHDHFTSLTVGDADFAPPTLADISNWRAAS